MLYICAPRPFILSSVFKNASATSFSATLPAIGFIIFCIIAWRYGAKPFVDVLESRANEVKEKLAEAETLRNEAKEVLNNYKILQQEAAVEAKNIILRAEENAKHLQKSAEENTKKLILRQEEQIKQKIKAAEKQALIDVKNIVVDLSISASEKCLNKEMNEKKSNDIKNHRWFKSLDWYKLSQKKIPAPFLP